MHQFITMNERVKLVKGGYEVPVVKHLRRQDLVICDITMVLPGDQKHAGHTQRVKVCAADAPKGESSEWFSGVWFEPR